MKKITLDGNMMTSRQEAHAYIKKKMKFPDYYGNNLDALADCLSEIGKKTKIELVNTDKMIDNLGVYHKGFIRVFTDSAESNENIVFITDKE